MPRILVDVVSSTPERELAMRVWRAANHARRRPAGELRASRVQEKIDRAELLLLAHYGTRPAGMLLAEQFVDGSPEPDTGHVSMLYVDPAVWGSGVGTKLLRSLQEHRWDRLSAWARADNRRGQRVLLAADFAETAHRSQLQDGEEIVQFHWVR
ncbi:GNAT family N-acetyltransferase [Nocardioides sp. BP30]|uniref:GNAT family N-acetyltransferase n=1 Tax=Nocardioides sp. BP30 TaxID=3036374 RepID=UPI0024699678|nr:GNAT family N-acetyltransferase [Nocardioides sp. BP30]WGL53837.1 GNAT family N-acetyltransferase [Nocardioides sp. BP30]